MARYITAAEIKADEAVPASTSDALINNRIDVWQMWIERITRNYFESRSETFILYGTGTRTLWLPIPVVSITSLTVNQDTSVLDASKYTVHTSNENFVTGRRNPKIVLWVRQPTAQVPKGTKADCCR